ncbi:hypothetical protein PG995_004930 [Apiospora arundinis]
MAATSTFTLAEILAVAKVHPFYSNSQYPLNNEAIGEATRHASLHPMEADLSKQPLLFKNDLYATTERLIHDISPNNAYRSNAYTSVTGGGGKSKPLFFATDALENRRQRARFGQFLRNIGLIQHGDWVLTTHVGGDLYRSLDLVLEIMENAGATSLAAGHLMSATKVVQLLKDFHINVLAGDGSQIIQVVHCISSLDTGRAEIRLDKIIYTSEALTPVQKSYIRDVLGAVKICSILGSAEAGPYGASSPDLVGPDDPGASYTDFIIDTRATLIEVFPRIPQSSASGSSDGDCPSPLPSGQTGLIVQTCLERLRNPLLRYVTGDWQVILDTMIPSKEVSLEIRLLRTWEEGDPTSEEVIVAHIRGFFYMHPGNEHRFKVTFVKDRSGFELSPTGRKLVKLVDRSAG